MLGGKRAGASQRFPDGQEDDADGARNQVGQISERDLGQAGSGQTGRDGADDADAVLVEIEDGDGEDAQHQGDQSGGQAREEPLDQKYDDEGGDADDQRVWLDL